MEPATDFDKVAKALRETFGGGTTIDWASLAVLLIPFFLGLAWLFWQRSTPVDRPRFPKKDLDFFDMVRQQKGLEEFDRDLLVDLAEIAGIVPVYKIILEEEAFDSALKHLVANTSPSRPTSKLSNHLTYLHILKKRLFGQIH